MGRGGGVKVIGLLAAVVAVCAVVRWVREHPALSVVIGLGVFVVLGCVGAAVERVGRARQEELAERERSIASADGTTGPEFEEWTARLMRRTGFRSVTVCGGADDRGADITAYAPDGRWTVVQCKRYSPARALGSPVVHTFAGPAHGIHRAELAVLVTTTRFTAPAVRDAALLNVVLVDRDALAAWAAEQAVPAGLGGDPPVSGIRRAA